MTLNANAKCQLLMVLLIMLMLQKFLVTKKFASSGNLPLWNV